MTPTVLIPDLNKDNSVLKHIFQHGFSVCNIKEKSESAVNPSFSRWGGGRVEQESGVKKKKGIEISSSDIVLPSWPL